MFLHLVLHYWILEQENVVIFINIATDLAYVVGLEYNNYNINNGINGGFKRIIQAMNNENIKKSTGK